MIIKAKVTRHIFFYLIMTPIVFLFAYGMFSSRTANGEIFPPFFIVSIVFFLLGLFGLHQFFEMLTEKKEYHFEINKSDIFIKKYINQKIETSYHIQRNNLKSFNSSYHNNYGAVTTTYEFLLKDDSSIKIVEDFGKDENKIMEGFILFGYLPKNLSNSWDKLNKQ